VPIARLAAAQAIISADLAAGGTSVFRDR
jgi:hypothetical protein